MVQMGTENNRGSIKTRLRNGKVINHRRRIPVGIQVVVGSLKWDRICPDLVQDSGQILRIGNYSGFIFRNGDVGYLQLLPSLFFICLEYLVERLVFSGDGECTVLQLVGREMRQDVGNVSGNIRSGGE